MTDNQLTKVEANYCNRCSRETSHYIRAEYSRPKKSFYYDDGYEGWLNTTYTFLECCGCESMTARRIKMDAESPHDPEKIFWPPRASRNLPHRYNELPDEIRELLLEIYRALYADSRRLALMGLRTVIDIFMRDKVGDAGTFKQKLEALTTSGYLGSKQQALLATALEAGSAAAHRAYKPSLETLNHVIDVVEHLVYFYALEKVGTTARAEIPSRGT